MPSIETLGSEPPIHRHCNTVSMKTAAIAAVCVCAGTVVSSAHAIDVNELWTQRIDGPASMNDYGRDVVLGADGSTYVAGSVFEQVDSNTFAPRFLTARYDAAGTLLWQRTYAGTFASGAAAADHIALDTDGNIIVSGSTNQGDDWAVVKYDADGNELWVTVYEADSTFLTQPEDMAVDPDGNIYLVGDIGDFINPTSGAVVKIASDGTQLWEQRYYGPVFDGALFNAVAVDDNGRVYAAGAAIVPSRASEFCIVQYDASGNEQWSVTDGSIGSFVHDRANDLAIDSQGNLIAVGLFGSNSAAGLDVAIIKTDPAGNLLWRETYAGTDGRDDSAFAVAIDSADNILTCGYSATTFSDSDALTLKFAPDGTLLWERRVAGDDEYLDWAADIAVDAFDNAYVVGTYDPIGGSRIFTTRYDADGKQQWLFDYAGPMGGGSTGFGIAVNQDGRVATTGDSPGIGTDSDIATLHYEQIGEPVPGDVDGDADVDVDDLLQLLNSWGQCDDCGTCAPDFNGDCVVDTNDLLTLLAHWS